MAVIPVYVTSSFLSGIPMNLLWTMINTIQQISFIPFLNIQITGTIETIFRIINFSRFDLVPFDTLFEKWGIVDDTSPYSQNFEKMTKESSYVFNN